MRVLDVKEGTSVDGPGLRTSIYFAGCAHHCVGCHNPQSWNFDGGVEISKDELLGIIKRNKFDVTFSGGDPIYQYKELTPMAKEIHDLGYTIWCYTGFTYEYLASHSEYNEFLSNIDVLVDGEFEIDKKVPNLKWKGSTNQRIIDLKETRACGEITCIE